MKKEKSCENYVLDILPQNGHWYGRYFGLNLGSDEFFEENIPYHACDVEWMKKYVLQTLPVISLIKRKAIKEFLETPRFLELLQDYQNKIIDWQINWSRLHHSCGLLYYSRITAEEKAENLFEEVTFKLTTMLKMDEEVIRIRLNERKEDVKSAFQRGIDAVKNMPLLPTLPYDYKGGIDADGDI